MEHEASSFETSEMLASFVASTPLLEQSWKLCQLANTKRDELVTQHVGEAIHVAFSGGGGMHGLDTICGNLVPLIDKSSKNREMFSAFERQEDEVVMVHSGFLHQFVCMYNNSTFQNQMLDILKERKSLVLTGHSFGGAIASLTSLWLLSYLHSISASFSVLCITFGSPMLGNKSLSRAILQERWAGNFIHVIGKHDIVPRLLFAPLDQVTNHLHCLLQFWHSSMKLEDLSCSEQSLFGTQNSQLLKFVLVHINAAAENLEKGAADLGSAFSPFGNYMFCSDDGAICMDNDIAVTKLLHVLFSTATVSSVHEDHMNYTGYVENISSQFLKRRGYVEVGDVPDHPNYDAGLALALQSSGISTSHEPAYEVAKDCLKMAKRMGRTPNLNSANLAIRLSKINPLRAQIEWYKASCDASDEQMGYYDSFKMRGASKRHFRVNMNRIKLARFWKEVIEMLETNQLPHDFHKRAKWVNASQFYKLLVEPLDIAEYYGKGLHRTKGHYIKHGRERRYEIFDRWWKDRKVPYEEQNIKRSNFASLTQDTCFWAKVEEAREWLDDLRHAENDPLKSALLWQNVEEFEKYSNGLVERKEVSIDVLAKDSSYSLWVEELKAVKSQLLRFPPQYAGFLVGEAV
ncbi:hypothetical protein DCAR_0626488 [Daucus carota subsp. sativus]|nr:hypothetical protein DCAR_0626488 [Daucus carota subsp. sativus]